MKRRTTLQALIALPLLPACAAEPPPRPAGASLVATLNRPDAFWHDKLGPAASAVLFEEDTERAFSSPLVMETRSDTLTCAACFLPLFSSEYKYDSGTRGFVCFSVRSTRRSLADRECVYLQAMT